jgi:hypothetical protein
MSIRRLTDVWSNSPYSGNALLIHLALADFADEDGVCFPRKSTLAKKARCTEETVRTTLIRMASDGEIAVLEQPERGRYARAGRFQLIPKKSGDEDSIPKSAGSIPKSDVPIPKFDDSTPPIGTVIEPSEEPSDVLTQFEEFWQMYGRVGSKQIARDHWLKVVKSGVNPNDILDGLEAWVVYWKKPGAANVKWPQGWLNERRWEGAPPPLLGATKAETPDEIIRRIAERDDHHELRSGS